MRELGCTKNGGSMAGHLHSDTHEPYRLLEDFCEKGSVSYVSRDPGDRYWNDLLGQHAQCPVDVDSVGSADAIDQPDTVHAATTRPGDAARLAADSELAEPVIFAEPVADSVDAAVQHAGPVFAVAFGSAARLLAVAFNAEPVFEPGCDQPGIRRQDWKRGRQFVRSRFDRRQRNPDFLGNRGKAGRQVRAER